MLEELLEWWRRGVPVGMATVVATFRSAPRAPGAAMLVGPGSGEGCLLYTS
ncbi:XdhC family protein, partial [Myceligenerans indicum]|uniref:XdhC family protein n=1 Tax=Myceligenerans indicum TaxID=2593663 RepID=UPI003556DDBB